MHSERYCECGCGERPKRGRKFVSGHDARRRISDRVPPNPSGLCMCGCGETTPIARKTRVDRGDVRGQHMRFVPRHWNRLPRKLTTPELREQAKVAALTRSAMWYRANRERHRTNEIAWRERNRERSAAYKLEWARQWRLENPDVARVQTKQRHLARKHAPFTEEAREYVAVIDGDPCSYCGVVSNSVDHIVAIASGGDGEWSNLTSACVNCNSGKGDRSVLSYLLTKARQREASAAA